MNSRIFGLRRLALRVAESPALAYGAVAALQLKVMWGMWWVRDLTSGDTTEYFAKAQRWHDAWATHIAWSPLYTSFYGFLLYLSSDAYAVTIAHRLLIAVASTLLVLAVMRSLLDHGIAWWIAAWWAVLPINYDTLYEVHLFAFLPLAIACLLLARASSERRGAVLALLLATTLLMRNELALATAGFGLACAVAERRVSGARSRLRAYAVPLVVAVSLAGFFYARSSVKYPQLRGSLERKHTLNVCQIYAFGYQQRHPEWPYSPWTQCQPLMAQTFGKPEPRMSAAIRANPGAMWQHFKWNIGLIPSGVQLLLFNSSSGSVNPDYAPATLGSKVALILTIVWLFVLCLGAIALWKDWSRWSSWIKPRKWVWFLLGLLAGTAGFVMIMQRPRPSYLFALSLGLMAVTGLALQAIGQRFGASELFRIGMPPLAGLLLLMAPTYSGRKPAASRPLLDAYRRLTPLAADIRARKATVVTSGFPVELCNYLSLGRRCVDYYALREQVSQVDQGAVVYLSEHALADFRARYPSAVVDGLFQEVAVGQSPQGPWEILRAVRPIMPVHDRPGQ